MNKLIGLYIHIPFCRRKCVYCDFYSLAGKDDIIDEYVKAVAKNIRLAGGTFDTVYFGGGTPSLLSGRQISDILSAADIAEGAEISAEINPDSADPDKLRDFKAAGINRISIGIQSLDDSELAFLGRLHNSAQAKNAILSSRKAGFDNISADLMLGLPYQRTETVVENIARLSELGVRHISAYMLKIEGGTPLSENQELISHIADEEFSADMYLEAVNCLERNGYKQYEISNFAKEGYECRHNMKYWRCEDYLGIGPSAHSCMDGKRFAVPKDIWGFINSEKQEEVITDDAPCGISERLMLALRLSEGFLLSRAGEYADRLRAAAVPMEKHGLLKINGNRIILTPTGFLVSNEIICRLSEVLEER
ncbi:MAG: radical SAM family heme chaperone HemW [Huintestinicola sp.]|uniref:radical SAM family heme chaperone HemW n=1 Tax=Huintestinicola sp. TaxID=2981661 RepID=UPI003F075090